jgi:hypothetical protein
MKGGTRFEPLDVEELERIAREQYARAFPRREGRSSKPRNVGATLATLGAQRIGVAFRGRVWELLPVSFEDGLRLTVARSAVEAMEDEGSITPEKARFYHEALRSVVALAPKYLRPAGVVSRLLWRLRLRRNPYRAATDAEVGQLLGFFLASQMRSRARFLGA